jgi:hypothetical protein
MVRAETVNGSIRIVLAGGPPAPAPAPADAGEGHDSSDPND